MFAAHDAPTPAGKPVAVPIPNLADVPVRHKKEDVPFKVKFEVITQLPAEEIANGVVIALLPLFPGVFIFIAKFAL